MVMPAHKPRRSCLYMPGSNARALEKAKTLATDVVIMDLEDAVLPDAKTTARQQVTDAVASGDYGYRELWIRINALTTPWGADDLDAAIGVRPDGILVPKINTAQDVLAVNDALNADSRGNDIAIWIMIETPLSILNLADIAATSAVSRLAGLVVGTNDLAKDLRIVPTQDRLALLPALSQTVMAGRAYGLEVIDGVNNALEDPVALEIECQQGVQLGFDGKTLIHPSQIEAANRYFRPSPDAINEARAICDAFAQPDNVTKGVIRVNGKMTERLHLASAERLIALDDAINAQA